MLVEDMECAILTGIRDPNPPDIDGRPVFMMCFDCVCERVGRDGVRVHQRAGGVWQVTLELNESVPRETEEIENG